MKKLVAMLSAFIIILAGCSSGNSDSELLTNTNDDVLTIWGYFEGAPKVAMDYYEQETGKSVEYVTIGWEDYQTKLNTVLGTEDAPDMIMLERGFMGNYLGSDNILSLDELLADDEQFQGYKDTTALATQGPGIINDEVKAIGWENTASAFFYRSDLASKCLDINSVEEMEEATQTFDGYIKLYEKLQSSDDEACGKISMFGYPDFYTGFYSEDGALKLNEDGSYTISKAYGDTLEELKEYVDSGLVYSPDGDKTQIVTGNENDEILGSIGPAWRVQAILEYEQPGQWAVADTPLDYSAGGTYLAVTPQADMAMVQEFLDMTFLNADWLVDNMDTFGMVGNQTVMNQYLDTTSGENKYFGGQNTVEKFAEINDAITDYNPVTIYDSGLGTSLDEVYTEYVVSGTIKSTDEAKEVLKSKLESLYPDLQVTIE